MRPTSSGDPWISARISASRPLQPPIPPSLATDIEAVAATGSPFATATATQVVSALQNPNLDPLEIVHYFVNHFFSSDPPPPTSPPVADFYAVVSDALNPPIVRFQPRIPGSGNYARLTAVVVPTTLSRRLIDNNHRFPPASFATITLGNTGDARIICTQTLTGCCLVFGWNNRNRELYIGHVEPDQQPANDRTTVVEYLHNHRRTLFPPMEDYLRTYRPNSTLFPPNSPPIELPPPIEIFGGTGRQERGRENEGDARGYGGYTVNFIGFISSDRIRIALIATDSTRAIQRRRMLQYPPYN